jgi:hypothetical protein
MAGRILSKLVTASSDPVRENSRPEWVYDVLNTREKTNAWSFGLMAGEGGLRL